MIVITGIVLWLGVGALLAGVTFAEFEVEYETLPAICHYKQLVFSWIVILFGPIYGMVIFPYLPSPIWKYGWRLWRKPTSNLN
jgi:hypothetical protein